MPSPSTPVVPGFHGDFIQRRLPGWLKHASVADLAQLQRHWLPATAGDYRDLADYQAQSRRSTAALADALKGLQNIAGFAEPLLKARLQAELGLDLEVTTVEFVQIQRESALLGALTQIRPRQQSLLQAALQNFAADVAIEPGSGLAPQDSFGLELVPGSEQGAPRFRYRYEQRLDVEPQRFARLCHDLDLGGQYQAHLREVYDAPATRSELRERWLSASRDQLRVSAETAFIAREISAAARQALLALADGERAPLFNGKPLLISQLKLFERPLGEVLVLSADRTRSDQLEPVLVYLPGAPLYPLKEYPSVAAAQQDLRINLRLPAYQAVLRRYLAQADQAHVFSRLDAALYHLVEGRDGVYQREPDPQAKLYVREVPVDDEVFGHLFEQHLHRLKADARLLAVPSADADEQAREARLAYWESLGVNLLNVAAFAVPAVAAVMAAVTAVQLVREVITGVEDWEHGDLQQAWEHLSSAGLNLALMAGLGLAAHTAPALRSSELVDGLVRVQLPDGQPRLWKPALAPYAAAVDLSALEADAQGLYRRDGNTYIGIDGRAHAVEQGADGVWRIRHPSDPAAYQPELRHNGQGAWRLQVEDPLQWQGLKLWRRLGHRVDGVSDEALRQLGEIVGINEDRLRRLHLDSEPLPALLEETLARLRIQREVAALPELLGAGAALPARSAALLPQLLARMPGWPREVLPGPTDVADDAYLHAVLAGLGEPQQKALLGPYLAEPGLRVAQLRQALGEAAGVQRRALFDLLYASEPGLDTAPTQAIRRDFPGLPWRLARALAARASSVEQAQLLASPSRLPLRLAEEARWLLEELRLNRACEDLYSGYPLSADSRRLALGALQQLPGWNAEVRLEVRAGDWRGRLLDSAGDATADSCKYLIESPDGYQALDEEGQQLAGVESLYAAILHALPDSQRSALGLAIDAPEVLRQRLASTASTQRGLSRQILGQRQRQPWLQPPLQLEDGQIGYTLSGRGDAAALRSPQVYERLRALYPDMGLEEANQHLDGLGLSEAQLPGWLELKQEELSNLHASLTSWMLAPDASLRGRALVQAARRPVMERIIRCWRRQGERVTAGDGRFVGYLLDLSEQHLNGLPSLSADFSHVASLHLNSMRLEELPERFLGAFSRLRWLSVRDNRLTSLPPALARLTGLTKLLLPQNAMVWSAEADAVLASLPQLKVLQLDRNPLGHVPDLTPLSDLRGALLRNCAVIGWPRGIFQLRHLEVLDLRENLISDIPQEVLAPAAQRQAAVERLNRATHLQGNPLSADSLARLQDYRSRTQITFGVLPAVRRLPVPAEVVQRNSLARWLQGDSDSLVESRQALWTNLRDDARSTAFFELLDELHGSADFREDYAGLQARVWSMLTAAAENTELRAELFDTAAHPSTCSDGAMLVFSQLEVQAQVRAALAAPSTAEVEGQLLRLARGLMRLDQLERLAAEDIVRRRVRDPQTDDVEVRLAYRVGLAESLELPVQARHMNFSRLSGVTAQHLEAARVQVLAAEEGPALRRDIATRGFWVKFLRQRFPERLEQLNRPYYARLEALDRDKLGMSDQAYLQQVETIQKRRENAEQHLFETLTAEAWNRQPGQTRML